MTMPMITKRSAAGHIRAIETFGQLREAAREDAKAVLDAYWDRSLPVDPVSIARAAGASVFSAQLGDDTFGMTVTSGDGANIYIDRDQPRNRFRFTCAHELGHYIDHSQNQPLNGPPLSYVDKRSEDGRGKPDEVYANEFAASLLMPAPEVTRLAKKAESVFDLAREFQVSLDAMTWRLRHLGIELGKS